MRSPIKVKSRDFKALSAIKKIVPPQSIIHSFLMLDGSIEFGLAANDRYVVAHTNKYVCYEFWWCVKNNPRRILEAVKYLEPIQDKNVFYLLQENWPSYRDPYVRSALFLLLNRYSATGKISSGDFNLEAYRPTDAIQLQNMGFQNLHLLLDKQEDFTDSINEINGRCDYILIPVGDYTLNLFEEEKLGYEDTHVSHKKLQTVFENTDKKMILVYKMSSKLVMKYRQHNITYINKYGRPVSDAKNAEEVLIANF